LDALLIISPEEVAEEVKARLNDKIRIEEVGWVEKGSNSEIIIDGVRRELVPKFRESAYTPVKSVVDEIPGKDWDEMKNKIDEAAKASIEKKKKAIAMLERDV
jgi:hydrogenase expression/formation protein